MGYILVLHAYTPVHVSFSLPCSQALWNAKCTHVESLVSFLCKHDVIKIELKQKGDVLRFVQPTMHSTLGVYDIQPPIIRYM